MPTCVYAVTTTSAERLAGKGIAGERLRRVGIGAVQAIVGEWPRVLRPTPANLRRYDEVIRIVAQRVQALLPARYGTCFDETADLLVVLRSREQSLRQALRHVRNRVQMTLRIVGAAGKAGGASRAGEAGKASGAGRASGAGKAGRASGASGVDYLRARAAVIVAESEIAGFQPVRAALERWVREERVDRRSSVTSVYHLIPRGSVNAYRAALARAASSAGIDVIVSGPWPAYAFSTW